MMYWSTFSSRSARGPCSLPNISRSQKGCCSGISATSVFDAYEVSCRVRAEGQALRQLALAGDSPRGPVRSLVGSPPPGATRGLGVFLAFCCHAPVYASQQPLSIVVFDGGAWRLFTRVRGTELLRSSHDPHTLSELVLRLAHHTAPIRGSAIVPNTILRTPSPASQ